MNPGDVSVLNVTKGDMKLTFNSDDPLETERASRVIQDMLRRGYSIFTKYGTTNPHVVA